jgi:hypothetical protein
MSPPGSRAAFDSFSEIATVRIELRDTDPVIWRQVEVPTSITLKVLHDIIQAAMGWFDCHLWEFTIDTRRYGLPMDEEWETEPRTNAAKVRLRDVLRPRKTRIDYLYDFGDCWEHRLTVTNTRTGDPDLSYPRYIAGERNAPPEDCGGIPGFYETLNAAANPTHPNHAEAKKWLDDYDPNLIDELPIKYALGRIANQRNAAKVRLANKKPPALPADQPVIHRPMALAGWIPSTRDRWIESTSLRDNREYYLMITIRQYLVPCTNPQFHPRQSCRCRWISLEHHGRCAPLLMPYFGAGTAAPILAFS